ncbi:DAG protein, chloroplast precursor [Musa troglodytarum]|uniref:DAG protein, chloroplast n=1 Tax=Musa troglodytarum TaxID=320322 RepID=A0A9E7K3K0_9LILI|nr:DAG protein, chloroplast precursor [Musa troglodytarum]
MTRRTLIAKLHTLWRSSRALSLPLAFPSPLLRFRPLLAAATEYPFLRHNSFADASGTRCFSTRPTTSSLNDPSPNWSNRPPKETILLDGCDFEHWLVVMEPPDPSLTRDEIIDSYIKTLSQVLGSEEGARMSIYSVSTKHYFAFGCKVSEEISYKIKPLPKVRWVLPDSYLDVKNKDYGGEPFIDGKAVPYDPKYHEEWVRNNARAQERSRRNDRPRNFDRSRNFERRRENMQHFQNREAPPMQNQQEFQNRDAQNAMPQNAQSPMPSRDVPPTPNRDPNTMPPPNYTPNAGSSYGGGGQGYQGGPGYQGGGQGYQGSYTGGNMPSGPGYQGGHPGYQGDSHGYQGGTAGGNAGGIMPGGSVYQGGSPGGYQGGGPGSQGGSPGGYQGGGHGYQGGSPGGYQGGGSAYQGGSPCYRGSNPPYQGGLSGNQSGNSSYEGISPNYQQGGGPGYQGGAPYQGRDMPGRDQ